MATVGATFTETVTPSTQPRPAPASISSAAAAAKAAAPQRSFIFDFLRTTGHIDKCYQRYHYSTQFNPQLSLVPSAAAGELLDPHDCVGAEDDEVDAAEGAAAAGAASTPAAAPSPGSSTNKDAEGYPHPDVSGTAQPAPYDASTVKGRALFSMSPAERPPGTARSLASGRELSELEALGRKHAEEMQLLIPPIVEALRNVMNNHDGLARHTVKDDRFDCFNTVSAVVTSLQEYIARLSEWCYVSPSTFIIACIFLDRMLFKYPRLLFSRQNIYKYYGVALRIANKCVDVKNISNKNYAHVIGISNVHLNDLEAKLLMDLRFGLYVSPAEFFWYARRLVPYHPTVQRLLSRTGPTMETINAALALADKQTTCRSYAPIQIRSVAAMAAHNTFRRRTSAAMHANMAALAVGGGGVGGLLSGSTTYPHHSNTIGNGGGHHPMSANSNSLAALPRVGKQTSFSSTLGGQPSIGGVSGTLMGMGGGGTSLQIALGNAAMAQSMDTTDRN